MQTKLKRSLSLLLVLGMVMGLLCGNAWAVETGEKESQPQRTEQVEESSPETMDSGTSGTCGENLTWKLEDGILTISGDGAMTDWDSSVDVPWNDLSSSIEKVKIDDGVTSIGQLAFFSCNSLTSVTIPNSVTSIGDDAFGYCGSLISVTIPDSVTGIGSGVFEHCSSLTSVTIPDSVTRIGDSAFRYCSSLTSVTIPDGITNIDSSMFENCSSLTSVIIPDSVIIINYDAFADCSSLSSITIPYNMEFIGNSTFDGCSSLTNVNIPAGVTKIGTSAFSRCSSLKKIDVAESNEKYCSVDGVLFNKDKTEIVSYPGGRQDVTYTIPNGVTRIGDNAFYGDAVLTNVIIPDSVTNIGRWAFRGSSLTRITIPNSVTRIEEVAFDYCENLKGVYISDISAWCKIDFEGGSGNPLYEAGNLYLNDTLVTDLTIPYGVTSISSGAFYGCSSLTSVTIPDSVTSIGDGAFQDCSSLTNVKISDGVTNIGNGLFYDCSALTSVTLSRSMTSIADYMFYGCESLTDVAIPNSVTSIGECAFHRCSSLTSMTIPDRVINIDYCAFEYCGGLTSVAVPTSMERVKEMAFRGCKKLTDVYYASSEADWKKIVIDDDNQYLTSATIHYNSTGPNDPAIKSISNCTIKLEQTSYSYDGKAKQPSVTVKDGSTMLVNGKDYTVDYQSNTNVGTATVTITGKGNYTSTKTVNFTIEKAVNGITAANMTKVASAKAQSFNIGAKAKGGAKLTYKSNNKSITVDKNGKVTVAKNYIGKATITISAAATTNYNAAVKQIYVTVNPTGTKLSGVTSAKTGQLTLKWAKNAAVTGYQVQYATSSKFTGAKTLNVKSNKTITGTLSKLKEKRKYYVRIRTYKTVGKVNYYSAWSAAKSATVKGVTAPAAVKLTSVKSAKAGEMTVKWGKNAKAGGYQLQYATASNFKGAKTVTINKAATTSTTVKKLTKGKKYYVRVRTYQKVSGKSYYSTWSASKNVTIKK